MLEPAAVDAPCPTWGQEVTAKMQCVLEDRTVVEKDCKLVFVIGEGDVNQVKALNPSVYSNRGKQHASLVTSRDCGNR